MEKRIFGRKYNTKTAKSITENEYFSPGDIRFIHEGVYLKRNGEYFLLPKVALELGMQTRNTEIALWAWLSCPSETPKMQHL